MHLEIRPATHDTLHLIDQFEKSFVTNARLVLSVHENKITYQIVPIPPFTKTYPPFEGNETFFNDLYLDHPSAVVLLAFADSKPIGQIIVSYAWNRYAYVQDFVVHPDFRQRGVGRALMQAAIAWAKEHDIVGVRLETQDINVTACKFYERMGFHIGGFDHHLYAAFHPDPPETALYWYLFF